MLEFGSLLSLFGAVNTTVDFCKNVSALWTGRDRDRLLRELVDHNRAMRAGIERLSDQILYAPDLQGVPSPNPAGWRTCGSCGRAWSRCSAPWAGSCCPPP